MNTHVKLVTLHRLPQGVAVVSEGIRVGAVCYEIPSPTHQINGPVVVAPILESDAESHSIRIRLDSWEVRHEEERKRLPVVFADMAIAVRAAWAFENDPGISWRSADVEIGSWIAAWLDREKFRTNGS
ncbi:hypothetical protein GCM10025787_38100 [Saccharopolyspora rosea]|uniref:Uncharacterized protein n=1 Tax=Saccharopolyspora rosea TaxID=524884 RepID=A0ABW3FKR3_9PSEU